MKQRRRARRTCLAPRAVAWTSEALMAALREMLHVERQRLLRSWQRSLPFGDCVSDRWQRARQLGFGDGTSVYDSAVVLGQVTVGRNTWIGPFTVLDGSGGLQIGDHCSISAGVQIYTHDTVNWALSGGELPAQRTSVSIGSRCYIGPNAVICRGVTIGDGCVIGANSLVNADVPSGQRAWGTPCRQQGPAMVSIDNAEVNDP